MHFVTILFEKIASVLSFKILFKFFIVFIGFVVCHPSQSQLGRRIMEGLHQY